MRCAHFPGLLCLKRALLGAGFLLFFLLASEPCGANPVTVFPAARTERVGDHLGFVAVDTGAPVVSWQWQFDGTNIPGATSSTLSLTNLQLTNAGTYSMLATLTTGPAPTASATLVVSNGYLPLLSSNLIVARVGDGLQSLNTTTGNTLYLDQFNTNATYVSTVMVPDSGTSALIVEGSGTTVGLVGSVLTLSSNQQYLNFAGYNQALPNSGVTFTGASIPRAIGAINGLGFYSMCMTNTGLYNGSAGQIRSAISIDGTVNTFWTAGIASAGSTSIKILTANQGPSGIPSSGAGNDTRVLGIMAGNLWVSSGSNNAGQPQGLYSFSGMPTGSPSTTATIGVATGTNSDPNDFAFSPDGLTVYIADATGSSNYGVKRWDYNANTSAWVFNYGLGTGAGNWGARGLTVDYSKFPGGGAAARGAVIYATTAEASTNRLIQIPDNSGSSSPVNVIATAGPNQVFRGVRFGPISYGYDSLQSQINELNVTNYGAVGDGVTSDTTSFTLALNAAASGNAYNGVYVPPGKYVITGTLTLNGVEMIGNIAGGWPADTMPMPTLLMRVTNGPGLIMTNGASLHGIAILYDQGSPTTTNAPAISLAASGITISSVRIQNPYDGITTPYYATPGRARLSDICIVSPVHVGIDITKCYDFTQFHDIAVTCPNAMSTGAAFVFGRVDEGSYTGLFVSNCLTGLEFDQDYSTSPAGGTFTGGFAGCSFQNCVNAMTITGAHKVKVSGGDFTTTSYGAVINNAAEVTLVGGQWQVGTGQAVQVLSASNVIVDASMFSRPAAVAAPLVVASNCTAFTLNHCQFRPGSTGLQLGGSIGQAVVIGNSFEDGGISNYITTGTYVIGTNLITASAPTGLTAVPGSTQVTLSWNASVLATSYNLQRSLINGGPYTTIATPTGTNYINTSLTNGVTYYYVVSAVRSSGQSADSSQASATPAAPGMTASYNAGAGQLTLSWPGWATNFSLLMTTNLTSRSIWLPVTNPAQSNNGFFNLTLPVSNNPYEFFELGPP
jgi:hypothetical protein